VNYAELYDNIRSYTQNYESDFEFTIPVFVKQAEKRIYNSVQLAYLRKSQQGTLSAGNRFLSAPPDFLSMYSLSVVNSTGEVEFLLNKDVSYLKSAYPVVNAAGLPQYYALFGPTVTTGTTTNNLSLVLAPTPDQPYVVDMNYFYYPETIVQGSIAGIGLVTGGSEYNSRTYYAVPLTGGSGTGSNATITVTAGVVTEVIIEQPGSLYVVGDVLSASQEILGSGNGFSFPVTGITNQFGTSWLGDHYSPVLLYGSLVEAYTFMKGETDMMAMYEKKFQEAIAQLKRLGDGLERGDAYRDGQAKLKVDS
jgi:hypothetical protein